MLSLDSVFLLSLLNQSEGRWCVGPHQSQGTGFIRPSSLHCADSSVPEGMLLEAVFVRSSAVDKQNTADKEVLWRGRLGNNTEHETAVSSSAMKRVKK